MRERYLLLTLAALTLTIGGCSTVFEEDREREPYGVDEPVDVELLPGLTETEVTDEYALYEAHHDALENEPYHTDWQRTVRAENGTVVERWRRNTTVTADRSPARIRHVVQNGETETADAWITNETAYIRHTGSDSESARYVEDPSLMQGGERSPLSVPLQEVYGIVDTVTVEGNETYRLEGEADELGGLENVSITLVLSESGYVTEYALDGERTPFDGERLNVEEQFTLETAEEIGVEEPAWLDEAKERAEEREGR